MKKIWKYSRIGLLSALLLLGAGTLVVGTAYGRYQTEKGYDVTMAVRPGTTFYLTGEQGEELTSDAWKETETGGKEVSFAVSHGDKTTDSRFSLAVAGTLGFSGDSVILQLYTTNDHGQQVTYEGMATAFPTDSVLYQQMGPGLQYRFYDGEGQELSWILPGGSTEAQHFRLQVTGAAEPGLLELILTEEPLNKE